MAGISRRYRRRFGRGYGRCKFPRWCFGSVEGMKLFYVLVTIVFWLVNFINIVHYVSCVDVELYCKKLFFCVKVFPAMVASAVRLMVISRAWKRYVSASIDSQHDYSYKFLCRYITCCYRCRVVLVVML